MTRRTAQRELVGEDFLEIHPDDAAAKGLAAGDFVELESRRSRVRVRVQLIAPRDSRDAVSCLPLSGNTYQPPDQLLYRPGIQVPGIQNNRGQACSRFPRRLCPEWQRHVCDTSVVFPSPFTNGAVKGRRDTVPASPERITVYPQERDPHSKPRFGGGVSLKDSIRNEKRPSTPESSRPHLALRDGTPALALGRRFSKTNFELRDEDSLRRCWPGGQIHG